MFGLLFACLHGVPARATEWPTTGAGRPLTVAAGTHRLAAAAGPKWRLDGAESDFGGSGFLSYRFGVTERLEYQLPFRLGFRLGGPDFQLSVAGGLAGIGIFERERADGSTRTHTLLPLRLAVAGRAGLGASMSWGMTLSGLRVEALSGRRSVWAASLATMLLWDVSDVVTVAPAVAAKVERARHIGRTQAIVSLGGVVTDGYGIVPTVALHIHESADLFVSAGAAYDFELSTWDVGAIFGFEWRP